MPIMSRLSFMIHSALVPRARAERSFRLADGQSSALLFPSSLAQEPSTAFTSLAPEAPTHKHEIMH